jgi:hypothetical protein
MSVTDNSGSQGVDIPEDLREAAANRDAEREGAMRAAREYVIICGPIGVAYLVAKLVRVLGSGPK